MCGIHFVVHSQATLNDKGVLNRSWTFNDFMKQGFIAGMLRGTDSSGIFQISTADKPYMHKLPLPGFYFTEDATTDTYLKDVDESPITVGHVRAATQGKINMANAHPFITDYRTDGSYIIGVHNGSLTTGWKAKKGAGKYEVDSEWALNHIASEGADAFEDFDGSYSFVWWDTNNPKHLMLARNDQRPMCIIRSKDGKSIMGASESGMLNWLTERESLAVEDDIYITEPGKMYRIDTTKEKLLIEDLGFLPEKTYNFPVRQQGDNWNYQPHAAGRYPHQNVSVLTPAPLGTQPTSVAAAITELRRESALDDAEWDEWDFAGWTAAESQLENRRMNDLLEATKRALGKGRSRLSTAIEDAVIDVEYVETAGIDEYGADDWVNPMFIPPRDWYSLENTSAGERKQAEMDGSFGVMVTYQPVTWDENDAVVVGEIMEPGDAKNALAFVRGMNVITYTEEMKDRMIQAVIIGVAGVINGEPEYIVAPLNDKGVAEIQRMAV